MAKDVQGRAERKDAGANACRESYPGDPSAPGEPQRQGDENQQWHADIGALLRAVACEVGAHHERGMWGEPCDVGRDEEVEKVAHIFVGRVDVLDPIRSEVLDRKERQRKWDEQRGCSGNAPSRVAQVACNCCPVEGAKHHNCDGGRDYFQSEGFLRSEQLRPAEQAKEQAVTPRCLCLYHQQAVEKYEHQRGAHHQASGQDGRPIARPCKGKNRR